MDRQENEEFKRDRKDDFAHKRRGDWRKSHQQSRILIGIIIIGVGVLALLSRMGIYIPDWMLSWQMFLIALGLIISVKHRFKKVSGYVLMLLGLVFLLRDLSPLWANMDLLWPMVIIAIGVLVLIRSTSFGGRSKKKYARDPDDPVSGEDSEDFMHAEAFFGGTTKNIVSKSFKGGSIAHIFGGSKINLTRADFKRRAVIDVTCIFGGSTFIVPADWEVKSEVITIFGGVDDKRPVYSIAPDEEQKTLIIKGICLFGGIGVKNYD